jgi:hypothetical protein
MLLRTSSTKQDSTPVRKAKKRLEQLKHLNITDIGMILLKPPRQRSIVDIRKLMDTIATIRFFRDMS